jgi:hypothetical protein
MPMQKVIVYKNTTIVLFDKPIGYNDEHHGMQLLKDKFIRFLDEQQANCWKIHDEK